MGIFLKVELLSEIIESLLIINDIKFKIMCECDGISNEKIDVYKIIDDETTPMGIIYTHIEDVIAHIHSWLECASYGDEFEFKIQYDQMTESEYENLPNG